MPSCILWFDLTLVAFGKRPVRSDVLAGTDAGAEVYALLNHIPEYARKSPEMVLYPTQTLPFYIRQPLPDHTV